MKSRKRKYYLWLLGGLFSTGILFWSSLRLFNNLSLASQETFNQSFQAALTNAEKWIADNQETILKRRNIALLKMLQECNEMHEDPDHEAIVSAFLTKPTRPRCWRALLEPDWRVDADELHKTMQQENIDNKWILYAIAAEKAKMTPEEIGLFDPDRWKSRQLTHQLWAIIHLRERESNAGNYDSLIEHLCQRITNDLWDDMAVEDIYIQKVAFVMRAGHQEMINRRWIERIIENQNPDGGWDDRWMYFFRSIPKPALRPSAGSNQHATVQALWLLYQIKYRYANSFGINVSSEE